MKGICVVLVKVMSDDYKRESEEERRLIVKKPKSIPHHATKTNPSAVMASAGRP